MKSKLNLQKSQQNLRKNAGSAKPQANNSDSWIYGLLLLIWLRSIRPGGGGNGLGIGEGEGKIPILTKKTVARKESQEPIQEQTTGEGEGSFIFPLLRITDRKSGVDRLPVAFISIKHNPLSDGTTANTIFLEKRKYGPIFQKPQAIAARDLLKFKKSDEELAKLIEDLKLLKSANGFVQIIKYLTIRAGILNDLRNIIRSVGIPSTEIDAKDDISSPRPETEWLRDRGVIE